MDWTDEDENLWRTNREEWRRKEHKKESRIARRAQIANMVCSALSLIVGFVGADHLIKKANYLAPLWVEMSIVAIVGAIDVALLKWGAQKE